MVEVCRSHSLLTPLSVGLLWTRDRPVAETLPDKTQQSQGQISMLHAGFEPTIPASERPQTYALDSAATGTGRSLLGSIFMEVRSAHSFR